MNPKELVFYNKEGYKINTHYNGKYHETDIYFDKNSTETFKTQGIYMFEHINGSIKTYNNSELIPYRIYNSEGIYCYPSKHTELEVIDVKRTLKGSSYFTKWLYFNNNEMHKYVQPGMYITIENFDDVEPSSINFYDEIFQVIEVRSNKIMIFTPNTPNNTTINLTKTPKIKTLNVIETGYNPTLSTDPQSPFPSMNEQRFNLITGDINDDTYTTKHIFHKNKNLVKLEWDGSEITADNGNNNYTPSISDGDKLIINIKVKSNPIVIGNVLNFEPDTIDYIIVDNIPNILKKGDAISTVLDSNNTTSNDDTYFVYDIDKINNIIYLADSNGAPYNGLIQETNNIQLVLVNMTYTIEQDIVMDNQNVLSIPVTFNSIVSKYNNLLNDLNERIVLRYEYENGIDVLYIESEIIEDIFDVDIYYNDNSNPIVVTKNHKNVYPIIVEEELKEMTYIENEISTFRREFVIEKINNDFISININGKDHIEPFDTSNPNPSMHIIETLDNWKVKYEDICKSYFLQIDPSNLNTNIITFESLLPDVNAYIDFSSNVDYILKHFEYEINEIKNELIITINGVEYKEQLDPLDPLNPDPLRINKAIQRFYDNVHLELEQMGIIIDNPLLNNKLIFNSKKSEQNIILDINVGFIPKLGDKSIIKTNTYLTNNNFGGIFGNKIYNSSGNFLNEFHIGQTISISGTHNLPNDTNFLMMDTSYTIIEIEDEYLTLSYQGPFGEPDSSVEPDFKAFGDLIIKSDEFIKKPQYGLSSSGKKARLKWTWKRTQTPDFFLYDFSGEQLKPYISGFPDYNGITPLCGINGEIPLKLIHEPNTDLEEISNPQKQQTVFDYLEHTLDWTDDVSVDNILPNPIQVFIGYRSQYEMWNKAKLYLEFIEDIEDSLHPTLVSNNEINTLPTTIHPDNDISNIPSMFNDYIIFEENYLEIENPGLTIDFRHEYKIGQLVELDFKDITNDGLSDLKMKNDGKVYTIKEVYKHKLVFEENVIEECNIQLLPKKTYPQYDIDDNLYYVWRAASFHIKVMPKILSTFVVYGESEEEDVRHRIHLDNRNKDVLTAKDFYIFKEVDINEEGIDWVFLNRKRQELLEKYGDIFNYVSSYRAIIRAINYFGYNDLTFSEYFQDVNPESSKYGQIFNLEVLDILDKATKNINYHNLRYNNLRNEGYVKTNMFSLGYRVTDEFGNFVDAYSLKEVQIKLLGLKRWLHENVVPLGTKIMDINAKYRMRQEFILKHDTYYNKNFKVEEYDTGIYFDVEIFKNIIQNSQNTYDVSIEMKTKLPKDLLDIFYSYEIKTYNIEIWNNIHFNQNSYVLYDGKYYTNPNADATHLEEPTKTNVWVETNLQNIPVIQHFRDTKHELDVISITITEQLDPMFEVIVNWHSGYGTTYSYRRTYHAEVHNGPVEVIY